MSHVTQLLDRIASGDPSAAEQLLPLVQDELRNLAGAGMESADHVLHPAGLIREACNRLVGSGRQSPRVIWHFHVAAAQAMRRILVDHARRYGCQDQKDRSVSDDDVEWRFTIPPDVVLLLDEAINRLEDEDPDLARSADVYLHAELEYAELEPAGRARIPKVTLEWTDHNEQDPGVTLMQLDAWLSELKLHLLNRIPERNRKKFLSLLRLPLKPPSEESTNPDSP